MSAVALRAAVASDLAEVRGLLSACGLPTDVEAFFPRGYVLAWRDAELVGCCGLEAHGGAGLLRSLAVAASARGLGLARTLVDERMRAAHDLALTEVYLLTTTAADFFRRCGFAEVPRASAPEAIRSSAQFSATHCASAACLRRDVTNPCVQSNSLASLKAGETT